MVFGTWPQGLAAAGQDLLFLCFQQFRGLDEAGDAGLQAGDSGVRC